MKNENKTVSVCASGVTVYYTDTKKHQFFRFPFDESSMLDEVQLYGNNFHGQTFQDYEEDQFTSFQTQMYRDALFGINHYSFEGFKKLSLPQKMEIQKRHTSAQKVLNKWKQQLSIQQADKFLLNLFPHSQFVRDLVQKTEGYTDTRTVNRIPFRDLGISKKQIADKLVSTGVLPMNFFQPLNVAA
jgi:hypothetical protein